MPTHSVDECVARSLRQWDCVVRAETGETTFVICLSRLVVRSAKWAEVSQRLLLRADFHLQTAISAVGLGVGVGVGAGVDGAM